MVFLSFNIFLYKPKFDSKEKLYVLEEKKVEKNLEPQFCKLLHILKSYKEII